MAARHQPKSKGYYLHAFFFAGCEGDPPEVRGPCVGVMKVTAWHINVYGNRRELRLVLPKEPGAKRAMEYGFSLEPGNRFYIVENDPEQVQVPNGPIIWRWDEVRQDSESKEAA